MNTELLEKLNKLNEEDFDFEDIESETVASKEKALKVAYESLLEFITQGNFIIDDWPEKVADAYDMKLSSSFSWFDPFEFNEPTADIPDEQRVKEVLTIVLDGIQEYIKTKIEELE